MITRTLLISILLMILIIPVRGQSSTDDKALRDEVRKYGQADVTIPYPGRQAINLITRNVSITAVRESKVYISLSKLNVEWFIAQKLSYTLVPRTIIKEFFTATSLSQAMNWQSYPACSQYDSMMTEFAADYPSICKLDTIGTSVDGRLILVLKISSDLTSETKPQVFYSSTIHGDEPPGFVLMLRLADYLLSNYTSDPRVENLVDNLGIWINPLANPDGTYTSGNTITSPTRYNANGVDLNRNFPDPMQSYSPAKETIDMVSFMKKHHFVISANFHSGDEVVNYPWDRWERLHADDAWFNYISRGFADTVHVYAPAGYLDDLDNGVTNGYAWYSVYGGRQDYMTYSRQGREVTIELDYTKEPDPSQLENLWQYNYRSLLGYLENALYGIHGYVKDASTSAPVAAEVFIKGHDLDSSQVFSDSLTGAFTRLLMEGTWDLTFSAKGYRDITISDVSVVNGESTNLTVKMERSDTLHPYIWPNPGSSIVKCVLPDKLAGTVEIKFIDRLGKIISNYTQQYQKSEEMEINVGGLPAGVYYIVIRNSDTGISTTSRIVVIGSYH